MFTGYTYSGRLANEHRRSLIRKGITKGIGLVAGYNRTRLRESGDEHPFLTGVHTPMTEEKTLFDLEVTGTIPAELDGRYLRIGPNPIAPDPAGYHWFTGDGMVHGIALKDGRAIWYPQSLAAVETCVGGTRRAARTGPAARP